MKTETIPMKLVGGHVLLDVHGVTTFLDTGSQVSFGNVPALTILGREHAIAPSLLGRITIVELRDGLRRSTPVPPSFDFDALVGLDVLAGTTLEFDWGREELRVTGPRSRAETSGIPPLLPTAPIQVNGRTMTAALDTGAWRSYLTPEAAADLPRVGVFSDYNPILGVLEPETVRVCTRFLAAERELEVGVAPPTLADVIRALGADVLVGNDVLAGAGRLRIEIGAQARSHRRASSR